MKINPNAFGAISEQYAQYKTASIAVLPIPFDGTSTWMKGADRGPQAIFEASAHMELYDIETDSEVYRNGIVTLNPIRCTDDPEDMVREVSERAKSVLQDEKFIVGIGGEHSISIGLVKAVIEHYPDLSVLQFDAHADTREEYDGSRYNHACVMARIGEMCPFAQIGIRSMDSSERNNMKLERTFFAHDIQKTPHILPELLETLTQDVYITIDLDVLDPSIMPSTGTPEPGGLDWFGLLNIIAGIIKEKNVVSFDIAELLPNPSNKGPDFLAAKLIYRILSMVFKKA